MGSNVLIDYHLHTATTIDGRMDELGACEKALSMGIAEIAFTNHIMLNKPYYIISQPAFSRHWEAIQSCQENYPGLSIRIGIEMDYYPGREDEIAQVLAAYEGIIGRPLDIVLGSVHEIKGEFFSDKTAAIKFFDGRDIVKLYLDYFEAATMAAQSGLFDVMAHPDLIKKYTNNLTPQVSFVKYRDACEEYIRTVAASGVGLEVNTKGLQLPVNEAYPSDEILLLYLDEVKRLGTGPILTVGSDAHKVADVGYKIGETISHLRDIGVEYLTRFDKRTKSRSLIG